ncbi:MAG TPA: serine/threonine-protein kinase, partial [Gemmataceae bacterium]|nr:serine/threonine-protein kinase [Gemmataceae bacterium]
HPPPSTVHPKITDFGLAKRLAEGDGQTSTGVILGTPSYMAPEQAAGRVHDTGPATDVYALGAILYELLTGKPPFSDASALSTLKRVEAEEPTAPSRLRTGLPRDLETICLKCLAKEPARRYATALDLAEDLRRFVDGKPITARAVGRAERTWKWIKRRPTLAALIGLSLVVTCLLAAMDVSWTLQVRAERDRTRSSLRVARHAIDGLYTQMATERLFDEPGLDPLCQELLEKAQQYYEELTQQHNNDPDVRRDVGLAWFRLGETRRLRGQPEQAAQAYEKAIAVQEPLCEADPSNPGFREDLANSHNWLGELLREHGRPALESERHYQAALTLQQELVQSFPAEPLYRMEMARSFYNLGIIAKDTNRRHEASADYDRAVTLLRALIAADPKPVNVRQDLARALVDRGVLQRLMGRPEEARRDYEQSIKLLSELRTELPSRAVYKFDLAIARQDLGNLLCSQHRFDEAQHEEQASLTLLRGLVADFSTRPRYRKKLGNAFDNLGTAFALAGQRKDAERSWLQALTLFEGLTREYPTTADYHDLLGMTLGNLGWLRTEQKNWPEARRLIERAIAEVQAALQPNALKPEYRQELRDLHQDLAETLVQLGDHAAAVRVAAKLARIFPERAQDSYYAACFVARCVPLAGADKPTTERYIEIALALLRRAADQATPALKRLPDERRIFQPLTSHAAWQATIRDLNAKVAGAKSSS